MGPNDSFSWKSYKPKGYKGTATWRIGGHVQSAEFPSFTHAHAMHGLVTEAYKAGARAKENDIARRIRYLLPLPAGDGEGGGDGRG